MFFAKAGQRLRNMSFRVKLPLMISLLVCIVLTVTAVLCYKIAESITQDKSKDEIHANSDRIGAGLYTSLHLSEQAAFLMTKHKAFEQLLAIRGANQGQDANVFSRKIRT